MQTDSVETAWVKGCDNPATEIPTKRCRTVGDLVDASIKKMKLQGSSRDFRLYAHGGNIPLPSLKTLKTVVREFKVSKDDPLIAVARPPRNVEPAVYGSMKFSDQPEGLQAYDSYMKLADELQKINATSDLKTALNKACKEELLPFVLMEGSSGTGKTQLALTLQKEFSQNFPDRPVYYLVGKNRRCDLQDIHKYFLGASDLFVECYQRDLKNISAASRDQLLDEDLFVFGFIDALLFGNVYGTASNLCIEKLYGLDLKQKIESTWKKASKRPIVTLDEIPDGIPSRFGGLVNELELKFIRNGFLSVGIPLIIMGSNSIAGDLSDLCKYEDFQTQRWCYVVKNSLQTIDAFKGKCDEFWYNILVRSRPSFANETFKLLQEQPELAARPDEVFALLFEKFSAVQKIKTNRFGKMGQVSFTSSSPHFQTYTHGQTNFVCSHFARLKMLDGKIMIMGTDSHIRGETKGWIMETVFPSPPENILLHLMILGGKSYRAIYDEGRPRPWKAVSVALNEQARLEGSWSSFRSNDAKAKTIEMEADLASAIFLASRKNGIKGIQVPDFIHNMAFELCTSKIDFESFEMEGFELLEQFNNIIIPFFSAPNVEWPDFIKNGKNWNLSNLYRVSSDKRKDVYGIIAKEVHDSETKTDLIAGQVSYYPNGVDTTVLKNMLANIMPENKVTVILTNFLKENICKTRRSKEFIEKLFLDDCQIVRLEIKAKSASLHDMQQILVDRDRISIPSRLCVIIETDPR